METSHRQEIASLEGYLLKRRKSFRSRDRGGKVRRFLPSGTCHYFGRPGIRPLMATAARRCTTVRPRRLDPHAAARRASSLLARACRFAGYAMPVQYPDSASSRSIAMTRERAACSMCRTWARPFLVAADHEPVARALAALVPAGVLDHRARPPALRAAHSTRTGAPATT